MAKSKWWIFALISAVLTLAGILLVNNNNITFTSIYNSRLEIRKIMGTGNETEGDVFYLPDNILNQVNTSKSY